MTTEFLVPFVVVTAIAGVSTIWVLIDAVFRRQGRERTIRLVAVGLALALGAALAWIVRTVFVGAEVLPESATVWEVIPFTSVVFVGLIAYMERLVVAVPIAIIKRLGGDR